MIAEQSSAPKTRFVGFKCPMEIFNAYLAGKANVSKVIIQSLTGFNPVKPAVKPEVKPAAMVFLELFNRLADGHPDLARELFNSLSKENQVILHEFLESHQ